ncbi:MSC_0620 family F1-like ATPase-associated subunit [Mycoplasmopsis felifaucium]|uniref:Uncharacterized protein n=1 Tax=Mycoplasmopsis felifaucium TaxID=35768 RepID=A0ABZ2RVZ5_9BACT
MSKKILNILKHISVVSAVSAPVVLLSANTNNSAPSEPKKPISPDQLPENQPKVPVLSNEFPHFKSLANDSVNKNLSQSIKIVISSLENELNKVMNEKDQEGETDEKGNLLPYDYKKKFSRLTYLNQLMSFVKDNEEDIVQNPTKYGINTIFPQVISQNEKINIGDVEFDGQTYKNVTLGLTDPTDYVKVVEGNGSVKVTSQKPEVNSITPGKLGEALRQYGEKMQSEMPAIFYNSSDFTLVEKDFDVTFEKNGDEQIIRISTPKGFNSWKDYFISKITPRYTAFDLTANQEIKIEEESEDEEKNEDPEKPPIPPIVNPDEPSKPVEPVEPTVQILALPILRPLQTYQYIDKSLSSLKTLFDSKSAEEKAKMFFFDNPINTRYVYTVESLKMEGANCVATVQIKDSSSEDLSRRYMVNLKKYDNDPKTIKFQYMYELQIKSLREHFIDLYKAVGLNEKISYRELRYQELINPLFEMVAKAVDFSIEPNTYIKTQSNVLNDFARNQNINELNPNNSNVLASNRTFVGYVIDNLKASRINTVGYYATLSNGFETLLYKVQELIYQKKSALKATLEKNLKALNYSFEVVNSFYKQLEIDIYKLKQLAQPASTTFDVLNWYKNYLSQLSKVSKNIKTLYELFNTKDITAELVNNSAETEVKRNDALISDNSAQPEKVELSALEVFKNAYAKMQAEVNDVKSQNNHILTIFGYVLLIIGLIGIIINVVTASIKFKDKSKKVKLLYLISGIAFAILAVLGSVFLGVGMIGV